MNNCSLPVENMIGWQPGLALKPSEIISFDYKNNWPQMVVVHYHQVLMSSPRAQAFLHSLGISDDALMRQYQLGFSDRTLGLSLPHHRSLDGHQIRGGLQSLGVLKPSGHELFRGALVVPVLDEDGSVSGLYGRLINQKQRPGVNRHIYWDTGSPLLYNQGSLGRSGRTFLCQNPLDALILQSAGFADVVALMGAGAFSDKHLEVLMASGVSEVVIAFDASNDSERSARLIAQALSSVGINCRRTCFPQGQDLCQFVATQSDKTKALGCVLREAKPFAQTYENLVGRVSNAE